MAVDQVHLDQWHQEMIKNLNSFVAYYKAKGPLDKKTADDWDIELMIWSEQ